MRGRGSPRLTSAPAGAPKRGRAKAMVQHYRVTIYPLSRGATLAGVQRTIVRFHQDARGDWVASLDCGHRQHVRHRPPFELRPWVDEEAGRESRLGTAIECPLCDRGEVPHGLEAAGTSPTWDQDTLPAAVRREHRLAASTWGRLRVLSGNLRFTTADEDGGRQLGAGSTQGIPPGLSHALELTGPFRLAIDFYRVPAADSEPSATPVAKPDDSRCGGTMPVDEEAGGDPACWARLVCPSCGAVVGPGPHRPGCGAGRTG